MRVRALLPRDLDAAAALAVASHDRLRTALPVLPPRTSGHFARRLEAVMSAGLLYGLFSANESPIASTGDGDLLAYAGVIFVDNFRNAGAGAFSPDWAFASVAPEAADRHFRQLYRPIAIELVESGYPLHSFTYYATEKAFAEALDMTGFGRIVANAIVGTNALLDALPQPNDSIKVRRAGAGDGGVLEPLSAALARHIEASPVFMPNTRGESAAEWNDWLADPERVVFVAEADEAVGYIKAEAPQFDVSDAVHDASTLAINGMFVDPRRRECGLGVTLLRTMADHALAQGKIRLSVDYETMNPEANAFWTRWFAPLSFAVERRI